MLFEASFGDEIDIDSKEILEEDPEIHVASKRRRLLEGHEQIHVTVLSCTVPGDRAEQAKRLHPELATKLVAVILDQSEYVSTSHRFSPTTV